MSKYIVVALSIACLCGCTKREEENAKKTGAAISSAIGLPPFVGEGIAALGVAAVSYFGGKKRGHACERKKAVKPNA